MNDNIFPLEYRALLEFSAEVCKIYVKESLTIGS